jgi:NAD(P)-dependent dehydrogenase (short-subunit alcohol dehydrogenase family)
MLTRLLEPRLIASAPSRVVNLSSVTHRYGDITSAEAFLRKKEKGLGKEYPATKLANTLFAFEHQRRLGHMGVQVNHCTLLILLVPVRLMADRSVFARQADTLLTVVGRQAHTL